MVPGPTMTYRQVMIFIDGGYLRQGIREIFKHDNINFDQLTIHLQDMVHFHVRGNIVGELIRVFYYDAIMNQMEDTLKYNELDQYYNQIKQSDYYEVRLGRLIRTGDGSYRQKGVDVLLAIDMITKAYENQYEIAILVAGDDDLIDVVKAVKDVGKRVYGFFFKQGTSKRLIECFDVRHELTPEEIIKFNISHY